MTLATILVLVLTTCLVGAKHARYTILPNSIVGDFGGSETVKNVHQCSARALKKHKIAFRVQIVENEMNCALLEGFKSFEAKKEGAADYVFDTSADSDLCRGSGEENVIKLVSGKCKAKGNGCDMLSDMNSYCHFVGTDIPNCVSEEGETIDSAKCPEGHTFVSIKKGTLLCCPPDTKFVKESGEKALCCPPNTFLEKEEAGRAICCPKDTFFQKTEGGRDLCCPKDTEYKGTSEGNPICCPADNDLNPGWTHCCPNGFTYKNHFKSCVGLVSMAAKEPKTTAELKQHCTDKANSIPVHIENAQQNQEVLDVMGAEDALIGLYVPRGKYKMHWIDDDSLPDFNNMNTVDRAHTFGDKGEHFGMMQSKAQADPGVWYIVNPTKIPKSVVCMAPIRSGV